MSFSSVLFYLRTEEDEDERMKKENITSFNLNLFINITQKHLALSFINNIMVSLYSSSYNRSHNMIFTLTAENYAKAKTTKKRENRKKTNLLIKNISWDPFLLVAQRFLINTIGRVGNFSFFFIIFFFLNIVTIFL